jgi:hypothetical protein
MITLCRKGRLTTKLKKSKKYKEGRENEALYRNFFDFFDLAVKKSCGSSLTLAAWRLIL